MARCLRRSLSTVVLALSGALGCSAAPNPDNWTVHEFKSFSLRAPAEWLLVAGGADSQAGRLQGPSGVAISYDFGLYSDPLTAPHGAVDMQTQSATVGGLPARWVRYVLPGGAGSTPRSCVGLHVPQVRKTSMGPIRFTAQTCVQDPASLALARSVMATVRFEGHPVP